MKLASLRSLRTLVSVEREYMIRRAVLKLVPVKHRSAFDQVFHCCVWKTASQWVRLVITDPRVYAYSGLAPVFVPSVRRGRDTYDRRIFLTKRRIFTPLYISYQNFAATPKPGASAAFFVIRDPRDLLVSWYYSNRYSHRPGPMLKAKRKVLESLSDEEGLAHTAKEFGEEIMPLIKSWLDAASANPEIKLIRYEDLTGKNQVRVWDNLLQHCDIHLPTETLASVLKTYSFGRLSGGREKGQEVKTEKYRKGVAGDWRNYFTSELAREFVRWNGDVVEKAGYAESGWSAEVR